MSLSTESLDSSSHISVAIISIKYSCDIGRSLNVTVWICRYVKPFQICNFDHRYSQLSPCQLTTVNVEGLSVPIIEIADLEVPETPAQSDGEAEGADEIAVTFDRDDGNASLAGVVQSLGWYAQMCIAFLTVIN